MRLTGVFLAVIAIGLGAAWILGRGEPESAALGSTAPDFTVDVIDGGEFTLSDARGSRVVLNLWASWCPPCREEIPAISAFAEANPGVTVVGVAVDDVDDASRAFASEIDAAYLLALDTDDVTEKYPHFGLPATYVIDERGKVVQFVNGTVNEQMLEELVSGS